MLEILIDNIFVKFGGRVFQQKSAYLWVQTGLFADLFLYSNEADFIQGLPKKMMSFH